MHKIYEVIVIGKGLIGSAAAKYLAEAGKKTLLVGPNEPTNLQEATVYASHYDEARVQRQIGFNPYWTRLHIDSLGAYADIEKRSGIRFYYPIGCLYVCPDGWDEYLHTAAQEAKKYGVANQIISDSSELRRQFPYFDFGKQAIGYFEPSPSGYLNPRALVKAQVQLCQMAGGTIMEDTIVGVERKSSIYQLRGLSGTNYLAEKVVVAAGSFVNFNHLLPKPLDIQVKGESIVFARLSNQEANRCQNLPTLLYEIVRPEFDGIYLLPPVKYPNGNTYIKMGMNHKGDEYFTNLDQVQEWFRGQDHPSFTQFMKEALLAFMPNLKAETYHTSRCIITRTPKRIPYLHNTDQNGLFVATTCNGYSAMSADAVGKMITQKVIDNQ